MSEQGGIGWSRVDYGAGLKGSISGTTNISEHDRYLAACLIGPGSIAGVAADRVDWLKAVTSAVPKLKIVSSTRADLPSAVACFGSPLTAELLVISSDGLLTRVPCPT